MTKQSGNALALALACAAINGISARAALVTYHGDVQIENVEVGTVDPTKVQIGDVFYFQFTLDDSVVDSNPSIGSSQFVNLFTDFKLGRAASNIGSWDPNASGTWTLPTDGFAGAADTAFIFRGVGFSPVFISSQDPMPGAGISTTPLVNPQIFQAHTDTGSGQTFAQMFGTLNPAEGSEITLGFESQSEESNVSAALSGAPSNFAGGPHPQLVPEPSTWALLLAGGGALLFRRGRKTR